MTAPDVEWGVLDRATGQLHRGPTSRAEAEAWVARWRADVDAEQADRFAVVRRQWQEVTEPRPGSEHDLPVVGQVWVPAPGVTFLAAGAHVRSVLDLSDGRWPAGRVAMDLPGKWNHGAADTLSVIAHPDVAAEWGAILVDAAAAARADEARANGR